MGASQSKMRAAVYFGLLVCAVALIQDGSAISFDDLVARAEEANHPPKRVKKVEPDMEMEEWSTDHLLGLDTPPPADMFDSLVNRPAAAPKPHKVKVVKKVAKKAHKVHKVAKKVQKVHVEHKEPEVDGMSYFEDQHEVAKKVAKHIKKVHKAPPAPVEKDDDDTEAEFASDPMGSLIHEGPKKAHVAIKVDKKTKHDVQMVSPHISDPAMKIHRHKKAHKAKKVKKAKKAKMHHSENILSGMVHQDEDVPEDADIEFPGLSSLPHAAPVKSHKVKKINGLQGLASAMLERSNQQDVEQQAAAAKKVASKAKKDAEMAKLKKEARKAAGGHAVHLDLSGDTDEEDDKDEKTIPSLESFMDDDDDDSGF